MKRNQSARVGLGAASLIMILLVLCLALMGVLSLMCARADLSLSRRHADLAEGYAKASAQAQSALTNLDELLFEAWSSAQDEMQYTSVCAEIVQAGNAAIEWATEQDAVMRFDAGEERVLEVVLERKPWSEAQEMRYKLVSYRLVDMKEWDQTQSLILMDM